MTFTQEFYGSEEEAKEEVRRGRAWGAMVFQKNYSESLVERTQMGRSADPWVLEASDLAISLDMSSEYTLQTRRLTFRNSFILFSLTDQQIGTLLNRDVQFAFFDFIEEMLIACDQNPAVGRVPLRFEQPVYGDRIPNFTDFAAPGVILTIIFFLSVALTSGAMLIERNEGMLERCLVAGVTGIEILFSHVVTQFLIMSFQAMLVLIISYSVFELTMVGALIWVVLLTVLTGLCGMCFGFVVSSACDNERTATYMAMGSFLPIVMLCGIIWPIEGMYPGLRHVALLLPLTKSTECLRSITQRGWSFEQPVVYSGFISTGIWVMIFLTISILLLKFKKG